MEVPHSPLVRDEALVRVSDQELKPEGRKNGQNRPFPVSNERYRSQDADTAADDSQKRVGAVSVQYSIVQYSAVLCSTVQYRLVQHTEETRSVPEGIDLGRPRNSSTTLDCTQGRDQSVKTHSYAGITVK